MSRQFQISDEDMQRVAEWVEKLPHGRFGCIGGRISYSFTPTTLGLITVVSDGLSGQELNLTNFEEW